MFRSWRIGRAFGIDIFLHPTFQMLLIYVGLFQGGLPVLALTSAAFGCVLLHELGHALMARRFGIRTLHITLYPIGGVAMLERIPRAPGIEILVALAGPAVNIALAALLWIFLELTLTIAPGLAGFATRLLVVNLGLALFNLIPAFPMDGGRVMRALLSGWLGRVRATAVAASVGRALALAFGAYSLYHGELVQVLLAAFIYFIAGRELAGVQSEERNSIDWPVPPNGFRWHSRGDGTYQLIPIVVPIHEHRRWR